jgi:hypothetical protein
MIKKIAFFALLLMSASSHAVWLNTAGKVTHIITYAGRETILVNISSDGSPVAECSNKTTFAISASISEEARARMYAMLLSAQATGRDVVLSYNDVGGCEPWGSNASVYRKIVRMR